MNLMVKVRVEGEPKEVKKLVIQLKDAGFKILQESSEYQNRSSVYVRKYLDVKVKGE